MKKRVGGVFLSDFIEKTRIGNSSKNITPAVPPQTTTVLPVQFVSAPSHEEIKIAKISVQIIVLYKRIAKFVRYYLLLT
ncbi:hypothetical protein BARVI_01815 [Barnesiella viscericola DSM 18177]|uniref:Uncharacterized protein n=1 Tax=Barnesiella viscericola DSM 18177 TaxID=880074 RepID=W0ES38_9BACT|nr:hypothetical protein BARVI_01815 [Barnesiella viscericola DSM 18177]